MEKENDASRKKKQSYYKPLVRAFLESNPPGFLNTFFSIDYIANEVAKIVKVKDNIKDNSFCGKDIYHSIRRALISLEKQDKFLVKDGNKYAVKNTATQRLVTAKVIKNTVFFAKDSIFTIDNKIVIIKIKKPPESTNQEKGFDFRDNYIKHFKEYLGKKNYFSVTTYKNMLILMLEGEEIESTIESIRTLVSESFEYQKPPVEPMRLIPKKTRKRRKMEAVNDEDDEIIQAFRNNIPID